MDVDWSLAACRKYRPERIQRLFFPSRKEDRFLTRGVIQILCRYCPVRVECLKLNQKHDDYMIHGFYGGFSPEDQRTLKDHPDWDCLCPHQTINCRLHTEASKSSFLKALRYLDGSKKHSTHDSKVEESRSA